MRKNPDTVGTLLVAAVALGGGYLAYRLLTDGKGKSGRPDAAGAWSRYDAHVKTAGPGMFMSRAQHDQLWNSLTDAEKDYAVAMYARPYSDMQKVMSDPRTEKDPVAVGFFTKGMTIAFSSGGGETRNVAPPPVPSADDVYRLYEMQKGREATSKGATQLVMLTKEQFKSLLWNTLSDNEKRLVAEIGLTADSDMPSKLPEFMRRPEFGSFQVKMMNAEKSARPVANLVVASAAPVVAAPAAASASSLSVPTQAQVWSALVAASKGQPPDVSEQQFGTLLWPTLADAEKRMLLDFFVAMGSPNAETAVPAVMGRPGFDAVMAKMMQAQSAALPKGTSGFGDYHHGAY